MSLTDLVSVFTCPLLRLLLKATGTAEHLGEEAPSFPRGTLHARAQRSMPTLAAYSVCFLGIVQRTLRLPENSALFQLELGLSIFLPPSKRHSRSRDLT